MHLIGSRAIKHHFPDFPRSLDKSDYDYLVSPKLKNEIKDGVKIEYHDIPFLSNYSVDGIISSNALYTLKFSHIFWDINWKKHIFDIEFMQKEGCKLIRPLYKKLYKYWLTVHKNKNFTLKVKNKNFFTSTVDRKYEHDYLHECIKYYDEPLFNKVKKDKSLAYCNKSLFKRLSDLDKLRLCYEEIYVIALERFIIPRNFFCSTLAAHRNAIQILVTSLTKGWFPEFIVMNYSTLKTPEINFSKLFRKRCK